MNDKTLHDPLGILAGAESMDEVKETIFTDPALAETYRKANKAIAAYDGHFAAFKAQGLTNRNASRSAARAMGITMKKVRMLKDNIETIRKLAGIKEESDGE